MAVRRILTWAPLAVCAAAPAHASPRSDPTAGRAVFTGATMSDATSIELDPAALGLGQLDQLYVAVTGVLDRLNVDLAPYRATSPSGVALSAPGAHVGDSEVSPGAMIAFIYHLAGDQITLGFEARTTPQAAFPDGQPALRYFALGGHERDWLASVGGSFRVTGDIFFGASLSHQNTFLKLGYDRDTALAAGDGPNGVTSATCGSAAPCGLGNAAAAERYDVDVQSPLLSTSNLRVNVGAVMQIVRDVWIGVAYHTPPGFGVQTELAGHVDVTRSPRDVAAGFVPVIRGQSVVEIQLPASVDAELRARLSHQLELHVGGRWEDLSRLQAYDVRAYGSTLVANNIPEWTERPLGMHDGFAGWAGIEQVDTGQRWLFGGRLGVESSALGQARTSAILVAPPSASLDVGAQLRISSAVSLQLSYGISYFLPVHVDKSAFDPIDVVECMDSQYDYSLPACAAVRDGYAIASGAGTYEHVEHDVRIGLRYAIP